MKKQILFLACGALIFASCGGNSTNQGQSQAQIDSTVNAKLAQHDAETAAKNDSTMKAIEKEKAEVIAKERHDEKKHEERNSNQGSSPVSPDPAPAPVKTAQDNKFDSRQQGNNQTTLTPDQQKAQDNKFNSRGGH